MKIKIAVLIVLALTVSGIGCKAEAPETKLEVVKANATVLPTVMPVPPTFDPANPFRFVNGDDFIELKDDIYTVMSTDFGEAWVKPELYNQIDLVAQLGECDRKIIFSNGYDGDSVMLSPYKIIGDVHSGISACDSSNAADIYRVYIEGEYQSLVNLVDRDEQMRKLIGQNVCFNQATGSICLRAVDVVLVRVHDWYAVCNGIDANENPEEYKSCTNRAAGTLERFFPVTGNQNGKHEMFLVFCSAKGEGEDHDKYILRLQP